METPLLSLPSFGYFWMVLFFVIGFLFLISFLNNAVFLVKQAEAVVIERLGRFHRILTPGLHLVVPFWDKARQVSWSHIKDVDGRRYYRYVSILSRIDLREAAYDFPKQNVITKDNVTMEINALLYYQITDPKAAVYEITNLPEAIEKLTQTTLRNVIGSLDLDESLVSRDRINHELRVKLDEATDKWGVRINRVELQEVMPPADIREAMEKQMRAERTRRAVILESEGKKRSAILEAEGVQESQVLRAKGDAESRIIRADAEAQSIKLIREAAPESDPLPYLIALNYIKMMPELTQGKDDKMILVPYEASSLVGSLASMKKMFQDIK